MGGCISRSATRYTEGGGLRVSVDQGLLLLFDPWKVINHPLNMLYDCVGFLS